jgi:hypothetical protein
MEVVLIKKKSRFINKKLGKNHYNDFQNKKKPYSLEQI